MVQSLLLIVGLLITLLAVVLVFRGGRISHISICAGIGVILIALGIGKNRLRSLKFAGMSVEFYPVSALETTAGSGAAPGAAKPVLSATPAESPGSAVADNSPYTSAIADAARSATAPQPSSVRPLRMNSGKGDAAGERGAGAPASNSPSSRIGDTARAQAKGDQDWRQMLIARGYIFLPLPDDELGPGSAVLDKMQLTGASRGMGPL